MVAIWPLVPNRFTNESTQVHYAEVQIAAIPLHIHLTEPIYAQSQTLICT